MATAKANAMFTITDTGDLNGRNLLQRSFFTKDPWTGPTYNAVDDGFGLYHDKKCLPVSVKNLYKNTNDGVDTIFPDLEFLEGVQYTISGNWAQFESDDKYNKMLLRVDHTDGTRVYITQPELNNVWSSFTLTSTPGKTVDKITASFSNTGITYIENFKLEVGASATDWTPAPEDTNDAYLDAKTANETADYAKTEIDGLEIGGRNLVLKGNETHSRTINSSGAASFVPVYNYSQYAEAFIKNTNQELTVSFDYEVVGNELDTAILYPQHCRSAITYNGAVVKGGRDANVSSTPTGRYIRTFTPTSAQVSSQYNDIRVYCKGMSPGTVINIKNIKVELGNRATDWTPAPEDIEESINSKNSVYYQATAPTGNKVGDTWFDTDNDYKISRWDGSTWVAAELGDAAVANLSASKLIAGSVMGNVILGGTIQAGGSDVGQDGKVLVKDVNDVEVASLDKNGLVATAGSIGGWTITGTGMQHETSTSGSLEFIHLNSDTNSIVLQKGADTISITPRYMRQQTTKQIAADEPTITIQDGDVRYSNVDMPIPNENPMSFRKWTEVSASRAIKDTLAVTIYHCMNLFWAHFSGSIPAGWTAANTQNVFIPIITDDTNLTNSVKVAPPENLTKYIIPTDLTNMRISVTVKSDGQIGISRIAEPFKGNATTTIAGYMETCDIFWAHVD